MTYFLTGPHPLSNSSKISSRQTSWASLRKIGPKMWPLARKQDFSTIWPSDLLFYPTQPIIKLIRDIIKTNILSKFEEDWAKMCPLVCKQGFSKIDLVTYFLTRPHPWSNSSEISRQTSRASLRKIGPKMWPLERKQDFSTIWPSDLLFDLTPPMFELVRDIIKTNILSKFEEDWVNNVAPDA